MAVTDQDSTEYAKIVAGTKLTPPEIQGRLRIAKVTFTQDGAGDANSTFELTKLPAGLVTLLGPLSNLQHSAWGTGTTLDVGFGAYTNKDGTAVDADPDGLDDGLDVAAAGLKTLCTALSATRLKTFDSVEGVVITAKAMVAGVPNDATLNGFLVYVVD